MRLAATARSAGVSVALLDVKTFDPGAAVVDSSSASASGTGLDGEPVPTFLMVTCADAVCPAATPLAFGEAPFVAHLPPELRVHPIA